MLNGKVLVAQGGGPTAVINQSVVGVVREARRIASVSQVYGAFHGVSGIVNEDFVDLSHETEASLEAFGQTPASGLGSTRDKPDEKYCAEIFKVLRAHEIGTFFYIGGNDSSDTLRILGEQAGAEGYPLQCVHIPKTIDNDLMINDHTPGFPSAARFVAGAFAGASLDNWALPGVYLGVVMGRHAGFLTAAAAGARRYADDGPHLVYLPERVFDMDKFSQDVNAVYQRLGRCVIAVSEGVHDAGGTPIVTKLSETVEKDAHGNVQLSGTGALADLLTGHIKATTSIKRVRGDTFGYLQRSFLGCVSDVDQREAREVAERAVQFAHWGNAAGEKSGSVTIHRIGDYATEYRLSRLDNIAGKTKVMPDGFINNDSNNVTDAFMTYLKPLLGSDMPVAHRLSFTKVPKILKA